MIYIIKNQLITAKINSLGAELISVTDDVGKEYIWQADKKYWGRHAPILFPVCGRLLDSRYTLLGKEYKMGSHGFARDMEFAVECIKDDEITFSLNANEKTLESYPFNFTLLVKYSLNGATLGMDILVRNNSGEIMPYMIGWHPGFVIDGVIDDYNIVFPYGENAKRHHMNSSLFIDPTAVDYPLGGGVFYPTEDEIYSNDTVILTDVGNEAFLTLGVENKLHMKQSDNLPFFAIWKAPHTEARYICLEPWSDIPSDGVTPECFDTRKMSRLGAGCEESYFFSVEFFK